MRIESASISFQVTSDKGQLTDQALEVLMYRVFDFIEREGFVVTDREGTENSCSSPRLFVHKR